ncbi:MAG: hypothetical protein JNM94_11415 [Phycisphaerae bacterium]|nr:hypothetical protein [Phycisphaerae bacterium]
MTMSRQPGSIGVDLGASRIVAVQFASSAGRRVHAATSVARRFDDLGAEVQRLARVMARQGFVPAPVVVAPSDEDVTTLELRVPAPTAATGANAPPVDQIVAAQLARLRKVDAAEIECAWWPTDGVATNAGVRALAIGLSTATSESIACAFDAAGLDVVAIESRPIAAARGLAPLRPRPFEVLLDVTERTAHVITIERGQVGYVRRLEVSPAAIRDGGMAARDELLSEMRLTLGYLQRRDERNPVDRLLSVDGAAAERFAEAIRAALEMPVTIADSDSIVDGGEPLPAEALVAVGLAARPGVRA